MKFNRIILVGLLTLSLVAATPIRSVAALSENCNSSTDEECFDETFFSGNDILYYSPLASCSQAGEAAPTSDVSDSVSGSEAERLQAILEYFTDKGMTLAAAAGFAGNMKQESGFNPAIIQGGAIAKSAVDKNTGKVIVSNIYKPVNSVGFGLVQWTFGGTTGPRQGPLYKKAVKDKIDITSIGLQLDYVWAELQAGYKTSTLKPLEGIQDPIEAAIIVHDNYEISADSDSEVREVRGGNAKRYFDQFKGKIDDGSGATVNTTIVQTADGSDTCSIVDESEGGIATVDGFTFPLKTTKAALKKGTDGSSWNPVKCNLGPLDGGAQGSGGNCHHHYNAADIFAETGTPILAAAAGEVMTTRGEPCGEYGCNVTIMSGRSTPSKDDDVLFYYTHMSKSPIVKKGQQVEAGQQIGAVGTNVTAVGTARHLHIDMLPGSQHSSRPDCASASCQGLPFLQIQELLIPAYQALPEGATSV